MRWIRNIFALIAIGWIVLWALSYFLLISFSVPIGTGTAGISSETALGRMLIFIEISAPTEAACNWHIGAYRFPGSDLRKEYWVYRLKSPRNGSSFSYGSLGSLRLNNWASKRVMFPLWLPTLIFGLWPTIALTLHIKRRYFTHGICRKCG